MRLASRGRRDTGRGIERIADAAERARLWARARRVLARAVALAAALTLLALLPR